MLDDDIERLRTATRRELADEVEMLRATIDGLEDDTVIETVRKFVRLAYDAGTGMPSAAEAINIGEGITWPPPTRRVRTEMSPGKTYRIDGVSYFSQGHIARRLGRSTRTLRRWEQRGWLVPAPHRLHGWLPYLKIRLYTELEAETIITVAEDLGVTRAAGARKLQLVGPEFYRECRAELARLRTLRHGTVNRCGP
jgi:transcriptional regulator with XRE-family HTH domain